MAGLRPKETKSDDSDVKINNENYKDSDYTGVEAKKTVQVNTVKSTEQIMKSAPTTQTQNFVTSDVTGMAVGGDTDSEELVNIKNSQKDAQQEQVKAVAQVNPDYLMEQLDYVPDDISSFITEGEDFSYQEISEDEIGQTFVDLTTYTNDMVSQKDRPPSLNVTTEFCHPLGDNGSKTTSGFGMRAIHYKNNSKFRWRMHSGVDLVTTKVSASKNPPVYAIADGKIYIGNSPNGFKGYSDDNSSNYGNYVFLYFTYKTKTFMAVYAHLKTVILGTSISPNGYYLIKKGEPIGLMGGTGGPAGNFNEHLHFEIRDMTNNVKWTKLQINMKTDTYNGEYCYNYDGTSAVLAEDGSNIVVSVSPKYDSYLDPSEFLKKPDKYLSSPTSFSHYA